MGGGAWSRRYGVLDVSNKRWLSERWCPPPDLLTLLLRSDYSDIQFKAPLCVCASVCTYVYIPKLAPVKYLKPLMNSCCKG